jgi:BirA family transcriptional regulator, biotin operon repressor / biotin---[acetyl-CoA-carboxylase] ligase
MRLQEDLNIATVRSALVGTRFGRALQHFSSVDSTNIMLLEAAAAGAPEGTVFVTDEQTAGRGRGGHTWHSSPGDGLYVSILVKPSLTLNDALWISLATGLATQRAIRECTGLITDIRWPNDLLLRGKKCGGILVETAVDNSRNDTQRAALRYAVIGVGVNINHPIFSEELAPLATSLRLVSGKQLSRSSLLIALLRALDHELTLLEDPSVPREKNLRTRFTEASTWARGKRVSVPEQGGYTGVTAGLNEHGFLLVAGDDGVVRTVLSGGVREMV